MQEIVFLELSRRLVSIMMSLVGYIAMGFIVGSYIDNKFFNNGVAIILGIIGGIILVTLEFIITIRKGIKSDASN